MKQTILFLFLAFCFSATLPAQSRHEFSVGGGGGISSLQYTPEAGDQKMGMGGNAGAGYFYHFSPAWSLKTGLDVAFYNAKTTAGAISGSYTTTNPAFGAFNFSYDYKNFTEKQSAAMLAIPLMAQYQTAGPTAFYGALGAKIGIPLSATYKTTGTLATAASFPDINVGGVTGLPDYKLDNYRVDQKNDLDVKVAIMLSAEAGAKWRLAGLWTLYTGVYLDYGLNNISGAKSALVGYSASARSADLTYGSITGDKINLLSLGLTVRLSFRQKGNE